MKKFLLLLAFFTGCFSQLQAGKPEPPVKSTTVLTDWMFLQTSLTRQTKGIAHVAYSRFFAYTAIAAYESVLHTSKQYRSLSGQLIDFKPLPAPEKNYNAAASLNAAFATVLRGFHSKFPDCMARIDSMEAAQENLLLAAHPLASVEKGKSYGKKIGDLVLQWASSDGWSENKPYAPVASEGAWMPQPGTAAAVPFWSEKRSFTPGILSVTGQVKHPVYDTVSTGTFYKMAQEVYTVSQNLTAEQKQTALFWDDSPNGQYKTVFGHWTYILADLIKKKKLPLAEATEAYAMMTIALHEACLVAWKSKYQHLVQRPVTYIRQFMDAGWKPLISTPPHPEFPAAHATLSYAAATALEEVFGPDCALNDQCYMDLGMPERRFSSPTEAAQEAGLSRLYGGIHYRYSIEQGWKLGELSAQHVKQHIQWRHPRSKGH